MINLRSIYKHKLAPILLCGVLSAMPAAFAESGMVTGRVAVYTKDKNQLTDSSNVVVFLDVVNNSAAVSDKVRSQPAVLKQKGKQFRPEVLPIVVGTTVDFPNDDNIFHNVFSRSKTKPFDLGMYRQGQTKSLTFDQPGMVKVYCNIHSHMVSYILVLNNPFFAVTDSDGYYAISGVPAGEYTVRAWQRFGPEEKKKVQVTLTDGPVTLDFKLLQEKVEVAHKNKYGKAYPAEGKDVYSGGG